MRNANAKNLVTENLEGAAEGEGESDATSVSAAPSSGKASKAGRKNTHHRYLHM